MPDLRVPYHGVVRSLQRSVFVCGQQSSDAGSRPSVNTEFHQQQLYDALSDDRSVRSSRSIAVGFTSLAKRLLNWNVGQRDAFGHPYTCLAAVEKVDVAADHVAAGLGFGSTHRQD